MHSALFLLLVLLPLVALVALVWWRFKGSAKGKQSAPIATSNHKSVRSFHYGPKPTPEPLVAAPPLSADNPISQLMPEEDFRAKEEAETQAEADRIEAEQMAARELETTEAAADAPAEPVTDVAVASEPAEVPPVEEPVEVPATTAPQLVSSVHALGAGAVSVFDMLGTDEPQAASAPISGQADPSGETPAAAQPQQKAPVAAAEDDTIAESLYDNPITTPAPTKNDEANRLTAVELRQRKRATLVAKNANQKAALTELYPGK